MFKAKRLRHTCKMTLFLFWFLSVYQLVSQIYIPTNTEVVLAQLSDTLYIHQQSFKLGETLEGQGVLVLSEVDSLQINAYAVKVENISFYKCNIQVLGVLIINKQLIGRQSQVFIKGHLDLQNGSKVLLDEYSYLFLKEDRSKYWSRYSTIVSFKERLLLALTYILRRYIIRTSIEKSIIVYLPQFYESWCKPLVFPPPESKMPNS